MLLLVNFCFAQLEFQNIKVGYYSSQIRYFLAPSMVNAVHWPFMGTIIPKITKAVYSIMFEINAGIPVLSPSWQCLKASLLGIKLCFNFVANRKAMQSFCFKLCGRKMLQVSFDLVLLRYSKQSDIIYSSQFPFPEQFHPWPLLQSFKTNFNSTKY